MITLHALVISRLVGGAYAEYRACLATPHWPAMCDDGSLHAKARAEGGEQVIGDEGMLLPDVKTAVPRANALGDVIFALPACAALRGAYPDAELVLLGQPWDRAFLRAARLVRRRYFGC